MREHRTISLQLPQALCLKLLSYALGFWKRLVQEIETQLNAIEGGSFLSEFVFRMHIANRD